MIRIAAVVDRDQRASAKTGHVDTVLDACGSWIAPALAALRRGENVVAGPSSWDLPTRGARHRRYVLTHDARFDVGDERVSVCTDPSELVERYATSYDELVVVGGVSVFEVFTPHATRVDLLETHCGLPGSRTYDAWQGDEFDLVARHERAGFDELALRRRSPIALDRWFPG